MMVIKHLKEWKMIIQRWRQKHSKNENDPVSFDQATKKFKRSKLLIPYNNEKQKC